MRTMLPIVLVSLAVTACAKESAQPAPATSTAATNPNAAPSQPAAPTAAATPSTTPATSSATSTAGTTSGATSLKVLTTGDVAVGKAPPDFSAQAQNGTDVHLAALKGKPVVVYFYPKDETPGCTTEACSFRDAWNDLQKKGVVLIGVSGDTDESHKAFTEHHKLPFLLVSDPNGELAKAYGVPFNGGYAGRQSFVIGADGNVKKIYRKVDVKVHAQEIAGDVK